MKMRMRGLALVLALVLLMGAASGFAEPLAADVTKKCLFKVSEGKRDKLVDGNYHSDWTYKKQDAQVAVELPDGVVPGARMGYWDVEASGYWAVVYDAARNLLRQRAETASVPRIETCLELLPEAKYVFLKMTAPNQDIAEMRVYSQGTLPDGAHRWNPPVEKADLMVVSTHQDDELIFFGGVIPYYAVAQRRPTVVVYMANCTRPRRREALNGLWVMGVRDYPDFINLKDKKVKSIQAGIELWGGRERILEELAARIRRYKPEVIVTHDFDGEYGHNQHKITALAMQYAIDAAADESQFPDSLARYGAWQVKKLYIHLYGENQLHMPWKVPLEELGGLTPLEMARRGYAEHVSQQKYYQVKDGGKYDNALFGLYSTTVGLDSGINDMFENIPTATPTPSPTPAATPTATPVPLPEITVAPTVAPTQPQLSAAPEVSPAPALETPASSGMGPLLGILGGALALGAAVLALDARAKRRRRRRKRRRRR